MPPPERLGRYALDDRIGEGGMGVVFRARVAGAEGFTRQVAIKRIHEALARDPGIREAFVAEALTAQRLHHGNIVQLIDVGVDQDVPYLVLEYVDGASLAELLRAGGAAGDHSARPLPIADALHVAESVAAALAYAHGLADAAGRSEGVVHRDVTPRNILVSRDGVVKLADFGIAKALSAPSYTLPGTFKGSLGYLAPEQARGEPVDARADQFSLGIVLHELLAGRNPIAARDVASYGRALAAGVPPLAGPPPIDAELAAIVARATAIDPGARHGSMDELRSELEAWRVARKIRTSGESLREVLRVRLDAARTLPGTRPGPRAGAPPRALGDALGDALPPSPPTRRIKPADPAARAGARGLGSSARRRVALAAAGLAGLAGAIALGAALFGARQAPASTTSREATAPAGSAAATAPPAGASAPPAAAAAAAPPLAAAPPPAAAAAAATGAAPPLAAAPPPAAGTAAPAGAAPGPASTRPAPRKVGRLKVMVVPWATVLLDDRPLGGIPIDLDVPAGRHRLTLHNPDTGDRADRWIDLPPGGLAEVTSW